MDAIPGRVRALVAGTRVFASARSRRRFLVHATVAALAFLAATVLVRRHLAFLTNAAELRVFIRGYGVWGPAVLILIQAAQVVVAPVPGQILAVVAGYLFGAWWGTLYNVIGIAIGSTVAFWLSRRFGRAYVERMVHEDALARFDAIDDRHVRLTLFVFFLLPGLPDDLLCFAGGLTRLPLRQLVFLAVVGRAPAFFLANVVGDFLGTDRVGDALVLTAALVALSALGYLNRDRIIAFIGRDR